MCLYIKYHPLIKSNYWVLQNSVQYILHPKYKNLKCMVANISDNKLNIPTCKIIIFSGINLEIMTCFVSWDAIRVSRCCLSQDDPKISTFLISTSWHPVSCILRSRDLNLSWDTHNANIYRIICPKIKQLIMIMKLNSLENL